MHLRKNMAMKFFALVLFLGELLTPSLMASFEVVVSNDQLAYQASVSHISTVFSETDNEERNQDDKHLSASPICFEQIFLSETSLKKVQNFFRPSAECPRPVKSLFALHSLLLI